MAPRQAFGEATDTSLRIDHKALDALCSELMQRVANGDWVGCDAVWNEFARGIEAHMGLEEAILLPNFAAEGPHRALLARQIRRQHRTIRREIERFDSAIERHSLRAEEVRTLVETLRGHAAFEDASIYAWVDGLSPSEAAFSMMAGHEARSA